MSTKLAIKVITASDLSFFRHHVKLSKQKAINLNSDVFIDKFYPGLRDSYKPVFFPLSIIGPGGRSAHRLTRKALRSPGSKNWRLNGEFIYDPDDEPTRYHRLAANDYAIIAFEGSERPDAITLILVSATDDTNLYTEVSRLFPVAAKRNKMIEVPEAVVAQLRDSTIKAYSGEHPLDALVLRDTVEDVLFGTVSLAGTQAPHKARSTALSPADLRRQINAAEEIGQRGEELFRTWLASEGHGDEAFEWVSQTHARSAFDYEVHAAKWVEGTPHLFVDVKTTRGQFGRPFHMSFAELRFAASKNNYRIARLYEIDSEAPKLRILSGVQPFASQLLASLAVLPIGVVVDSVQIEPSLFTVDLDGTVEESPE